MTVPTRYISKSGVSGLILSGVLLFLLHGPVPLGVP